MKKWTLIALSLSIFAFLTSYLLCLIAARKSDGSIAILGIFYLIVNGICILVNADRLKTIIRQEREMKDRYLTELITIILKLMK